jgi:hypothetical protein
MNDPAMPKPVPTRKIPNWVLLVVLLAVAAALYAAVVLKIARIGF